MAYNQPPLTYRLYVHVAQLVIYYLFFICRYLHHLCLNFCCIDLSLGEIRILLLVMYYL